MKAPRALGSATNQRAAEAPALGRCCAPLSGQGGRLRGRGAAEAASRQSGPAARWALRLSPGLGTLHSAAACGLPAAASWRVTSPRQRSPDGKCPGRLPPGSGGPAPPPRSLPGRASPTSEQRREPRAPSARTASDNGAAPERGRQSPLRPVAGCSPPSRSRMAVVPRTAGASTGCSLRFPKRLSRCLRRGRRPCLPAPHPPFLCGLRAPGKAAPSSGGLPPGRKAVSKRAS